MGWSSGCIYCGSCLQLQSYRGLAEAPGSHPRWWLAGIASSLLWRSHMEAPLRLMWLLIPQSPHTHKSSFTWWPQGHILCERALRKQLFKDMQKPRSKVDFKTTSIGMGFCSGGVKLGLISNTELGKWRFRAKDQEVSGWPILAEGDSGLTAL